MRKALFFLAGTLLLGACSFKYYPKKPFTGLQPSKYVAVINLTDKRPDLSQAEYLYSIRSIDWGYSIDCAYADIVEKARRDAMKHGANLMLITVNRAPETDRSQCNRIEARLYNVQNLAGMEAEIFWSPARPVAAADLRAHPEGKLPPINCNIRYRLLGNFYKSMTVRTITTFLADSTGLPDRPEAVSLGLRRAPSCISTWQK